MLSGTQTRSEKHEGIVDHDLQGATHISSAVGHLDLHRDGSCQSTDLHSRCRTTRSSPLRVATLKKEKNLSVV